MPMFLHTLSSVPWKARVMQPFLEESIEKTWKPLVLGSQAGSTIMLSKPTFASHFQNVATPACPSTQQPFVS